MRSNVGDINPAFPVFENESLASSFTSDSFEIPNTDNVAFEFSWSGSDAVGVLTIETSVTGNNFQAIPDTLFIPNGPFAVSGATGSHVIDLNQLGPNFVRAVYTRTSGSAGVMNGFISGKEM